MLGARVHLKPRNQLGIACGLRDGDRRHTQPIALFRVSVGSQRLQVSTLI
jgi:hypothetical protein